MFLMETKKKFDHLLGLRKSLGYDHLITVEPEGLSGGLALMWKDSYQVDVLSSDKRIIDMKVKMGSLSFFMTCVYGDPVQAKRRDVWDRLVSLGLNRDEAWILVGDFNELLSNDEKSGGATRSDSSFWDFRDLVQNCKLREVRYTGNCLSWGGWREKVWVQCRLDRSFGNSEWFSLFPKSNMEYLEMWASDHRPIIVSFALEKEVSKKGRFFFDKRMLSREGFEDLVRSSWEGRSGERSCTMERIGRCRRRIMGWKKNNDLNSRNKIVRLKAALEAEVSKMNPSYDNMKKIKQELAEALREEELFWRQKCREEWLRAGDRNTKYFHNCVKGRRMQNRILMLLDEAGQEHFSEGAKGNIAVEFFRDLFMSSNPFDLESLFLGFPSRVTASMNSHLTRQITSDEIRHAAFSVKGSSAPGEDGLTGLFYQRFWHIVGPDLTEEILGFFNSSVMPAGWNHTQISLLPKILNPSRMQDMRPISLCSVQYKIISKILCNRLKSILPEIISETQGAFVSGRQISDNIIIAHEMVHGLRTVDKVAEEWMAIKTDMSKAYDRVEWNFIETLLEKMGFDHTWVSWVMACVSSVSFSVLLNGESHGYIRPERGLRQGDPLSPFLFILCAEALVSCLNASEESGRIHGVRLTESCPSIHHLLFADDSLLLCKANSEEAKEILACLKLYGDASGQMVNRMKSSVIFGAKVTEAVKAEVKGILGIDQEGGEGSYLGLPECFSGSKIKLLSFIREKLQGRLRGWFAKSLSQGGKEILMKSVCLALPVYAMSCFKLPKDVCSKLTSVMIEFWWSSGNNRKKISWVAWEKLCKEKELGGLGFRDIEKFNQALLTKQAWRVWSEPNSLLSRLLCNRYFSRSSFLDCCIGARPSFAWRSMLHGRDLLKQGLLQDIGDGENTRVWLDNWILAPVPRPPKYRQEAIVDLTMNVSDLLDVQTGKWDPVLVRQFIEEEDVEFVLQTKTQRSRTDKRIWGFSKNGKYDVKSGYKLIEARLEHENPQRTALPPLERQLWSTLWKTNAPPKLRHFLWRVNSGALAVKARLQTRGIHVNPICSVCGQGSESICHVLFNCTMAKEVWEKSGLPLPPAGWSQNSVFLNLHFLMRSSKNSAIGTCLRRAFPWILWHLWKARNAFCFERVSPDPTLILRRAMEDAAVWLNLHNKLPKAEFDSLSLAPTIEKWQKPLASCLKCNVGSSWDESSQKGGAAWVVRDDKGRALHHSRRAFSNVSSVFQANILALHWAAEAMRDLKLRKVIFEFSAMELKKAMEHPLLCFGEYQSVSYTLSTIYSIGNAKISYVSSSCNLIANLIAVSVTRDQRHHSYVARNGPGWLSTQICQEALA